jgi:uncharacterized protein (TIGR00369 family)
MTVDQMTEFVSAIPFNRYCGMQLDATHDDGVTIGCDIAPDLLNGHGTLHGGLTGAIADAALGCGVCWVVQRLSSATTVELKVNYLRPAVSGRVKARAKLVRVGSTLCTGTVEITDENGQIFAIALGTYMLLK